MVSWWMRRIFFQGRKVLQLLSSYRDSVRTCSFFVPKNALEPRPMRQRDNACILAINTNTPYLRFNNFKPEYNRIDHSSAVTLGYSHLRIVIIKRESSMKITAELIQQSPQFTNPLNERQLDLRGYKITAIENMGATLNFFECIDLSDNEIRKLGNFSYLDRLTSLILTNNRIRTISDLADSLPNIQNIFLMNNKLADLQEIAKLGACKKLQRLVLVNNIVTELPKYRSFAIAKIPSLRVLDFQKVSAKERAQAAINFPSEEAPKK